MRYVGLLLGAIVIVLGISRLTAADPANPAPPGVPKWEYVILSLHAEEWVRGVPAKLQKAGADGWDAVGFLTNQDIASQGAPASLMVLLKRPVK